MYISTVPSLSCIMTLIIIFVSTLKPDTVAQVLIVFHLQTQSNAQFITLSFNTFYHTAKLLLEEERAGYV